MAALNEYTIYAEFTTAYGSHWAVQLDESWEVIAATCNERKVTLTPKRKEIIFNATNQYCDLYDLDTDARHESRDDDDYEQESFYREQGLIE